MVRLQKFMAESGLVSRRKAEDLIKEGAVTLNGEVVTRLGVKVDPSKDHVKVNGKKISRPSKTLVFAVYKPKSCVTTLSDPQERDVVSNYFPVGAPRLFPIGRLDYDAEGLLLVTNDGDLAHKISHPSHRVWKRYFIKIKGRVDPKDLASLRKGPVVDGEKRQAVKVKILHFVNDKTWLEVMLREGVNRQIKKMFGGLGHNVLKIKRYSIGNIELKELKSGESRTVTKEEISELVGSSGVK